ncbi:MAG: EAL domain-containing protein [Oscillatoria sp. SIO1A7]|nr:EAL domain-containing protein [Oscillatoria sp. SIO1A7]
MDKDVGQKMKSVNISIADMTKCSGADEMEEDEAQFWPVLEESSDGIFVVTVEANEVSSTLGANFRLEIANQAALAMLWCRTDKVKGLLLRECLPLSVAGQLWLHLNRCLQQGKPIDFELFWDIASETTGHSSALKENKINNRSLVGNTRIRGKMAPKMTGTGKIEKIVGILPKPKNGEVETEARLLARITQAIASCDHFEEAIGIALEGVCETSGWDYGEAWIPSRDGLHLQCVGAGYSSSERLDQFKTLSQEFIFAPDVGIPGRVWVSKRAEWYQDVYKVWDKDFLRVELAKNAGIKASLAVPIMAGDRVLAVLVFFMTEKRSQDRGMVDIVLTIAAQLGSAMQHKQVEEALRAAEQKYRSIFENAVEGIFQTTVEGRYLTVNPMLARIYGYDSPEELTESLTDIEHQLYFEPKRRFEFRRLLQANDAVWGFESEVYRKDGSTIWISENARAIRDESGNLVGYEGTVVDITKRKQAERELQKRDSLLQGVAEAMNHLLIDSDRGEAVKKALATLGMAAEVGRVYICIKTNNRISGQPTLVMEFDWTEVEPALQRSPNPLNLYAESKLLAPLLEGKPVAIITTERSYKERSLFGWDEAASILMVPIMVNNDFWGYVGFEEAREPRKWSKSEESILVAIAASIGGALQRYRQEEQIRHQAFHDLLTGLPNRKQLDFRLPVALELAQQGKQKLAVMFLDLDRFKIINDTLGHPVGDELLRQATERLQACLRENDTIVRWGGDEFILILERITHSEDAAQLAQRLLESLRPAFDIDGNQLYISGSIGISLYPDDGSDANTLIKNADIALYRVKEQGRNNYKLYKPGMDSEASELLALDNDLHGALERQEFLIHYQPQVNAETGQIIGMEALLRWQHPKLGIVPPKTFIPLAEENGIIVELGKWVLHSAVAQNKIWQDAGLPKTRAIVNLSTRQFHQPDLIEMVLEALSAAQMEPQWLELEINETTAMKDVEFTSATLDKLQEIGVSISIDDFGVGYASLSYLKKFSFQTIKIHQSFVQDLATNPKEAAIVTAMITLGQQLNLSVVAEGVETEEQRDLLRTLGCREMQGYLFGKPVAAKTATRLLARE